MVKPVDTKKIKIKIKMEPFCVFSLSQKLQKFEAYAHILKQEEERERRRVIGERGWVGEEGNDKVGKRTKRRDIRQRKRLKRRGKRGIREERVAKPWKESIDKIEKER